jgi:hypothetical protein
MEEAPVVEPTKFQAPQAAGSAGIREASRWSTTVLQEREREGQDPETIEGGRHDGVSTTRDSQGRCRSTSLRAGLKGQVEVYIFASEMREAKAFRNAPKCRQEGTLASQT